MCRVGSQQVGGEALHGAMAGGVMVGLLCNGLAWRDLSAVLRWQGFRAAGWGHGGACMPWRDLCAMLGWRCGEVFVGQVGVEVGLACHVGMASEQCHSES